jgi:iron complex transport system substrate-binding protein
VRVVSVLPSATETVFAVGAGDRLVGRSEECDYPAAARDLPVVMRARTSDSDRSSAEIDERVRGAVNSGEGLYSLDVALLARLSPDVILTQDLCRVCSVTDEEVLRACRSAGVDARIVSLSPARLDDVWTGVATIAAAVGATGDGRQLAESLRHEAQPRDAPAVSSRPRVAVLEWTDPPILAGLWTPDSIQAAGGTAVGPLPGEPGRRTTWRDLAQQSPDLVLVSPCSFRVERTRAELATGAAADGLAALRPAFGTWLADEAHFSRPGPRLIDGVRLIRSLLERRDLPRGGLPAERWTPVGG